MINPRYARTAGAVFKIEHIRVSRRIVPNPIMSIDPADGGNCEWGIAIGGLLGGNIHLSHVTGIEGEGYDWLDPETESVGEATWSKIFDLADEFDVHSIILEINLKSAHTSCRRYMRRLPRRFRIIEHRAKLNKLRRIRDTMEPMVNNGIYTADPSVMADSKTQ